MATGPSRLVSEKTDQGAIQVSLDTTFPAVVLIFVTAPLEHDFISDGEPISEYPDFWHHTLSFRRLKQPPNCLVILGEYNVNGPI
jgi:hypothetical protein